MPALSRPRGRGAAGVVGAPARLVPGVWVMAEAEEQIEPRALFCVGRGDPGGGRRSSQAGMADWKRRKRNKEVRGRDQVADGNQGGSRPACRGCCWLPLPAYCRGGSAKWTLDLSPGPLNGKWGSRGQPLKVASDFKNNPPRTSLVVLWLRLCTPKARGLGSNPWSGN